MQNVDMIFNFIGVSVVDWPSAFKFFSETLGLNYQLDPKHGDWAIWGGGWDDYYHRSSRSAVFELFDDGRGVTDRRWGMNQGIRPGFQVFNLESAMAKLDLPFTVHECPWGKTAEFATVEGIRFALAEIPFAPCSDDLSTPYIGHVAIKCADLEAMQHFYVDILGFTRTETGSDYTLLTQSGGFPSVILEPGGSPSTFDVRNTPWQDNAVRAFPVFLSMMTSDLRSAYDHFQSNHVTVQRELISHQSWGGTDIHIADPDGNAIQVVQYE
jgi:catechol 2,3-dioxygenase-like lactoylglutathione lyase family enzyme